MADVLSGTGSAIRMEASVTGFDAAARTWTVHYKATFFERVSSPSTFGSATWIVGGSPGVLGSAGFSFDWRPGGLQSVVVSEGDVIVTGDAAGNAPASWHIDLYISDTGTSGGGSGGTAQQYVTFSPNPLKVIPATPTPVSAVRDSDTQATVSWTTPSTPTNGQPTSQKVRKKVNGGAFDAGTTISPAPSVALPVAANQKLVFGVQSINSAGSSAWSADTAPIYTKPAAPTLVQATKTGADIVITWTPNVGFTEHQHLIEHGIEVSPGSYTWDGSVLATKASGISTHTHTAPNPAQKHVYRVWAKNTDAFALTSAQVQSNTVQLLAAPNKPSVATTPPFQDKAATFRFSWTHNPVDSSAQTKHQTRYSTNGGSSWTTASKTTSTNQYLDYAASTFTANQQVLFQVRTKGAYDSGSDGDASYSPWSDSVTVTFKTKPVASIVSPANASTHTEADLTVELGFTQAEGATFVAATISLYNGATLLEQITSNTLVATTFQTRLADQVDYVVTATVTDSNGLVSDLVTSTFTVDYTEPVPAGVTITYLPDSGAAQLDLVIPEPSETRVVQQSISGHPGAGATVPTDYSFSHRQPFNLPVAPTEWRIHIRNRNFLTDTDYTGNWTIDAYVGPSAGLLTGNFSGTPQHIISAAAMTTGDELVSEWFDDAIPPSTEYLLSIGATASGTPDLALNPNPSWTTADAANAGVTAPAQFYSVASGFLDAWIESRVPFETQTVLTIGHSLNGPGNVDPGTHPWYADEQSWMGQWALALGGVNESLTVGGSWPGHYLDDSPKWEYYAGATPSVVALWVMSSLIQGGGTLADCQSELRRLVAKVRALWGDSMPILVFTEPGRIDLDATGDVIRQLYNDWVRTNPVGARAIIDADDILTDPGSSPARLRPDISADGFHFTLAGHTEIAVASIAALSDPPVMPEPAVSVSIDRIIDGVLENVYTDYPAAAALTLLDTTPTINGTNLYKVTTHSDDGASTVVTVSLVTTEMQWAFMSKGPGYADIIRVGGKLAPVATPTVDSSLVKASGRVRPIGLYSTTGGLVVDGVADFMTGEGSTPQEIEAFLTLPGKACYRDPSGRRMFGLITGQVSRPSSEYGTFPYTVTETT